MDQAKVALAVVKKYHFWILSGVVLITGAAVWFMASDKLAKAFEADKSKIETATKSLDPFNAENPPNALFKEKVDKLHEGLKVEVADVWKELYEKQVRLFVWPDLIAADIAKLQPGEPIPPRLRDFYNNNIVRDEWKRVLAEVDFVRPEGGEPEIGEAVQGDFGGMPIGMGGNQFGAEAPEMEGLVVWDRASRQAIIDRYYSDKAPSDLRVRLTQEDLWVFEQSLVAVVQLVNKGARDRAAAPIKKIEVLDLAQWAINAANASSATLYKPGSGRRPGGMGPGGMGPGGMGPGGMGPGGGMGGGAGEMPMPMGADAAMPQPGATTGAATPAAATAESTAASLDAALIDGRYIDDQGKPMKDDKSGPFAEFKQMFVYMKFVMDQRRLPNLMAACANVKLPIETRQVRVHVGDISGVGASGNGGGMMGGGMMGGGMMGGGMMGGGMMGGGMMGGQTPAMEAGPYDAVVELSGIIYLYNPPDLAKLGTGSSKDPATRSFSVPKAKVTAPGASKGSGMMNYTSPSQ
jgi:hypothetical protein